MSAAHCNHHAVYNPACQFCQGAHLRATIMGAPSSAPEVALHFDSPGYAGILRAEDETPPPEIPAVVTPGTGEVVEVPEEKFAEATATRSREVRVLDFSRELLGVVNRFLAEGGEADDSRDACVTLLGLASHVFNQGTTDSATCEDFSDLAHDIYHDYTEEMTARSKPENLQ